MSVHRRTDPEPNEGGESVDQHPPARSSAAQSEIPGRSTTPGRRISRRAALQLLGLGGGGMMLLAACTQQNPPPAATTAPAAKPADAPKPADASKPAGGAGPAATTAPAAAAK